MNKASAGKSSHRPQQDLRALWRYARATSDIKKLASRPDASLVDLVKLLIAAEVIGKILRALS